MRKMVSYGDDDREAVCRFVKQVEDDLCTKLLAENSRFPSGATLVNRFRDIARRWEASGLSQLTEGVNELCVAKHILAERPSFCSHLEYEPPAGGTDETIDFGIKSESGEQRYLDVKTIHPKSKDAWEQFERVNKGGLFPRNFHYHLEKDGMGGELWHNDFASRSKMLEYTVELESKASAYLQDSDAKIWMVFCGSGWHWGYEDLQDFAFYYFTGRHARDDAFSKMEQWDIAHRGLELKRIISGFGMLRRPQTHVDSCFRWVGPQGTFEDWLRRRPKPAGH